MVVPYQQGLSERIKNTCKKYGVQVHFKGGKTIKGLLMAPKDKDPITNKSGIIYRYKCSEDGCEEETTTTKPVRTNLTIKTYTWWSHINKG